ncbi:MAG: DUF6320 domain-containing protein [Agathobacter sp.]|nr:DUF6320 domain-containing protein [Agathobacter sp.]
MSRCNNCKIQITDETDKCPFCRCVLEKDEGQTQDKYPEAWVVARRFHLLENIVLFLSILIEAVLVYINYVVTPFFAWSLIVGLVLLYANVVLRLAVIGKSGYMFKTICLVLMTVIILIAIDYLTGYNRWSLNYVMPAGILFMDIGILVLMIVNHRNWQSYMMAQLFTIVLSIIPIILLEIGEVTFSYLTIIAFAVSVFIFLGTLIIGDQRAKTELKRRFHI